MHCIFCEIIKKKTYLIYENDEAVAVLDAYPRALGHSMVLPRVHVENIVDLPEKSIEGVFMAVKKTTELLSGSLSPDGFTIGINHGRVSGQAIDHLHIHIIPRWKNDGGKSIHSVVDNQPKESLESVRNKIVL